MGISTGTAILASAVIGAGGSYAMSRMNKPKVPAIPAPPPAAKPPTSANASVINAGNTAKMRAAAGAGASGTNPTGGQGLITPPTTTQSVLLG